MWRWLIRAAVVLLAGWLLLIGSLAVAMRQPPETFGRFMARVPSAAFMVMPFRSLWMNARDGSLKPGDPAPDFTLRSLDGARQVQLASFRGSKPVVLVFGSYT